MSSESITVERAIPGAMPQPLSLVLLGLVGLGVVTFAFGLLSDPATAWRAFHINYLYYGAMAQGGLILSCAFVIVGAVWPGPIRRIAEGLAAWVPVTFVLFLVDFMGREYIYTNWIDGPPPGKEPWLNMPRLFFTNLAVFGVLALLTLAYLRTSVRPTLEGVADRVETAKGLFASWSADWKGDEAEQAASAARLRVLAPIICMLFAIGWSLVAFDQVMSLSPAWYSNLFGAYFSWGGFLSAIAATALISVLLRGSPALEGEITKSRMHDLGKMLFAFSIFWMYLFFSQYIVIWYGNLPEETFFIKDRLGSQFLQDTSYFVAGRLEEPYAGLTLAVWACCWIIPFVVLLGQQPKKTPVILGGVSLVSLVGFWLERNVLVWPSLLPEAPGSWFGLIQIGIAVGFAAAFVLVYLLYSRVFPGLAVPQRS